MRVNKKFSPIVTKTILIYNATFMSNLEYQNQEPQNDISTRLLEIINGFKYESETESINSLFENLDNSISLLLGKSYICI